MSLGIKSTFPTSASNDLALASTLGPHLPPLSLSRAMLLTLWLHFCCSLYSTSSFCPAWDLRSQLKYLLFRTAFPDPQAKVATRTCLPRHLSSILYPAMIASWHFSGLLFNFRPPPLESKLHKSKQMCLPYSPSPALRPAQCLRYLGGVQTCVQWWEDESTGE